MILSEPKTALITGVTGQDGSYLVELLLAKGYTVHGIKRRSSTLNTTRIDHLYQSPQEVNRKLELHYGDLTDASGIARLVAEIRPDEVYNLGAQSHVAVSFDAPEYTADVNALGALRLLEGIRLAGIGDRCRYYQASTSELYGLVQQHPQTEKTPFYPRSPYAVSKLYAYWITVNYRESYDFYACNGILFNHESCRRGETFVTRKITRSLARIAVGLETCLYLGNLSSLRDWGHAKDYVYMQWLMLQQDEPQDFVIAMGHQMSVRDFISRAAYKVGLIIEWRGSGINEVGFVAEVVEDSVATEIKVGDIIIRVDRRYFRPAEVESLLGDPALARDRLNWEPEIDFEAMVDEMVAYDLQEAVKEKLLTDAGYETKTPFGP